MIFLNKVSKVYPAHSGRKETVVFDNISFKIEKGEFVIIVGKSGSGKTTLFRMILGEEKPTEGKIFLNDQDIHKIKKSELHQLRRKIGVAFQDYKLLPKKTAYENISYVMEGMGMSDEKISKDVLKLLELANISDKAYHFPNELSGGEQQRVAIARALICSPGVFLADEPTGNLDPYNALDIVNLLVKINELGTTVVLATHNKEIINYLNKRVITLDKGKIVSDEQSGKFKL